ncbi:MAG TPA: hypothetical protein VE224_03560 [Pseudolabrys sp.]|nr:hypothetical protein [Pseudolabrys sp.]
MQSALAETCKDFYGLGSLEAAALRRSRRSGAAASYFKSLSSRAPLPAKAAESERLPGLVPPFEPPDLRSFSAPAPHVNKP